MVIVTSPLMKDKVLKIVEEIEEIDVKHINLLTKVKEKR